MISFDNSTTLKNYLKIRDIKFILNKMKVQVHKYWSKFVENFKFKIDNFCWFFFYFQNFIQHFFLIKLEKIKRIIYKKIGRFYLKNLLKIIKK